MKQEHLTSAEYLKRYGSQVRVRPTKTKRDYKAEFLQQIKIAGLPEPLTEHRFHSTRKWALDFAWVDIIAGKILRVGVEYQGGIYAKEKSGHTTTKGIERDCEKLSEASLHGFIIILITAKTVENGKALRFVERALKEMVK